jgi:hypothetical protein
MIEKFVLFRRLGEFPNAKNIAEDACDLALKNGLSELAAVIQMRQGWMCIDECDFKGAQQKLQQFLALSTGPQNELVRVESAVIRAGAEVGLGQTHKARAVLDGLLDVKTPRLALWLRCARLHFEFDFGDEPHDFDWSEIREQLSQAGMFVQQVQTYEVEALYQLAANAPVQAHATLIAGRKMASDKPASGGSIKLLLMSAITALACEEPQEAYAHIVAIEPHAHYLTRRQEKSLLHITHCRAAHALDLGLPVDLNELDEKITAFPAPLYRARLCHHRARLAQEVGDSDGQQRFIQRAKEALAQLQGGSPVDLKPLLDEHADG